MARRSEIKPKHRNSTKPYDPTYSMTKWLDCYARDILTYEQEMEMKDESMGIR